jgi:glucose/arabinose dehydrogenase
MVKMVSMMAAACALAGAAQGAAAQAAAEPKPAAAYSAVGTGISYYNTPNRSHTNITQKEVKTLATATVVLAKPGDVLVQFTSQLSNTSKAGCPCSARAALVVDNGTPVVDNGTPVVVKRTNLSGGSGEGAEYVPDRQGLDGSVVFTLPAGRHDIAMTVQQVGGSAETIQSFYANMQAIVFTK